MNNNETPVGCGYDYLAVPQTFLERLKGRPILDITDDNIRVSNYIEDNVFVETKLSVNELYTSIEAQANFEGQYKLFSANIAGAFDRTNYEKEKCAYTHLVAIFRRKRHTFDGIYKNCLNPNFKQDVLDVREDDAFANHINPDELFEKYGTHVVSDALVGGMLEMFIVTKLEHNETAQSIEAELKAGYGNLIKGDVDGTYSERLASIESRSNFSCHRVGGAASIAMSTISEIHENVQKWVESLNEPANLEFCGFPGDFDSSFMKLSQLVDIQSLADELDKAYDIASNYLTGSKIPALKSHLGDKKYIEHNNDMVTALSQYSINKAIKSYWKKGDFKHKVAKEFYVFSLQGIGEDEQSFDFNVYHDTDVVNTLPKEFPDELRCEDLYQKLVDLHIFDVPADKDQRTEEDNETIDKAYCDYYLKCAVRLEFGIPEFFTKDDLAKFKPVLLQDDNTARYHQTFANLDIVETSFAVDRRNRGGRVVFTKVSQSEIKKPSTFIYDVRFKMDGTRFNDLDPEVQNQLKAHFDLTAPNETQEEANRRIDRMYSVSELCLDLSKLSNPSQPDLPGFSIDTKGTISQIIPEVIKKELNDSLKIGRALSQSSEKDKAYYVIPTEYQFSVNKGPFNHRYAEEKDLRTLNYVINLGGDNYGRGISVQKFDWEWIGAGRKRIQSGVTVINRETIFNKFLEEFRVKVLQPLRLHVWAATYGGALFNLEYKCSFNPSSSVDNHRFTLQNGKYVWGKDPEKEWHIRTGEDKDLFMASCGFWIEYFMGATASWTNEELDGETHPCIRFDVPVRVWTDLPYNKIGKDIGHNRGTIYNKLLVCKIIFNIDDFGNITLVKKFNEIDRPTNFSKCGWSQFGSFGKIDSIVDQMKKKSLKAVNDAVDKFEHQFDSSFKINAGWVMPGEGTFTFEHERFTESGDLAIDVNYYITD